MKDYSKERKRAKKDNKNAIVAAQYDSDTALCRCSPDAAGLLS